EYRIEPPLNVWEKAHRQDSPEERTAHLHMSTYGPDLNLPCSALDEAALVDAGRKLTHYSPWLVPLSFSSPFRDGGPWGGLSARTAVRTGVRPAALVFLPGSGSPTTTCTPAPAGSWTRRSGRSPAGRPISPGWPGCANAGAGGSRPPTRCSRPTAPASRWPDCAAAE